MIMFFNSHSLSLVHTTIKIKFRFLGNRFLVKRDLLLVSFQVPDDFEYDDNFDDDNCDDDDDDNCDDEEENYDDDYDQMSKCRF